MVRVGAAHHGKVVECWVFADVMGVFVARWVNVSLRMVLLLNKVKGRTGEYLKGASSRVALTGCRRAVGSHEGR